MPSELKVFIYKATNLPIMERGRNTTDAYCEVYFGKSDPRKTVTVFKSLDPVWSQTFDYEIADDDELQENLLEIRVIDEDVISSDDLIGTVLVDMSSLLYIREAERSINGNFPIYDINLGIRGMLNVEIKLTQFLDEKIVNNPQ